jgi:tetratricopeptide (TPR) repeat protein
VWKSEIARLLPDLLIQYPDLKPAGPLTESWQRQRLFEALARGFLRSNKPLLLLLDDLQWCDRDTLEWLHFLLRYKSQIRLMVIGTVRTEETRTNTSLTVLLDQLRSSNQLTEIELEPLSKTETAELAVQLARRTLTEEVLNELYSETEGNPLFVVEMVRAGLPDRATQNAGIKANPIPAGLQAVITYQLNQVGSESREVLRLASVIGRSFTFKVLERAAEGSQDVILRSLEDLWQRQIVREEGAESYYFSHEKLRAVAYAELSGVRRKVLHQRVAEALKSEYSLNLDSVSGQIASHYEQGGLVANAVEFYQRAANVNQRLFANSEAIDYLRRALKLLITGQLPNVNVTAALLNERLGDLLHMIGRYGEARSCYETALGYYPEQERLPRTQLQRRIGNTWRDQYHYEEAFAACTAAETTLGLTSTENDIQIWQCWSQIQMDRMQTHYWLGQASEMEEIGKTAWPIVEKYGSPLQLARMYQFRAIAGLRRDRYVPTPEVVAVSRQFLKEVEKLNDTTTRPSALFQLGFTLLFHNDLDEAEKYLQEALTLSEHTGDVSLEGRCLTYCTILFRKRGQIEAVREFAGRSLELATTNLMYDYIGAASGNLAWLAWRDNRLSDAQVQGERALEAWDRTALAFSSQWTALWPLIGVALAEKRPDSVAKYVALLLAPQQQQPPLILETALEAVLHAAKLGETEKVLSSLVEVRDLAHSLGYL